MKENKNNLFKTLSTFLGIIGLYYIAIKVFSFLFSGPYGKIIMWGFIFLLAGICMDGCFHTGLFIKNESVE